MVGLDDKFTERQGAGSRKQVFAAAEPAQSAIPVDHPSSVRINRLRGGNHEKECAAECGGCEHY